MKNWIGYSTAFLLAAALAAVSAIASMSTIMAGRLPERAIALPIVDGNAYANRAVEGIAFAAEDANLRSKLQSDAIEAFRSEPTSSRAVSLLALDAQLKGDERRAETLYADSLMLSQRERLSNLSAIEIASQRGMVGFILDRYDVLLRTGGPTSDALFAVLSTALREQAIVPHLQRILTENPPWAATFWLKVAPAEGAIENVGRLRQRLLASGVDNPAGNDADIIWRLATEGRFDMAYDLFTALAKTDGEVRGRLLNGEFKVAPKFPPFDWVTYSAARFGTEVDPVAEALVLFTESTVDTLMARQLVPMPAGRYEVRLVHTDGRPSDGTSLTIRLRCATSAAATPASVELDATNGLQRTVDYSDRCAFTWVELWARKAVSASDFQTDVSVDSFTLAPARPRSRSDS